MFFFTTLIVLINPAPGCYTSINNMCICVYVKGVLLGQKAVARKTMMLASWLCACFFRVVD